MDCVARSTCLGLRGGGEGAWARREPLPRACACSIYVVYTYEALLDQVLPEGRAYLGGPTKAQALAAAPPGFTYWEDGKELEASEVSTPDACTLGLQLASPPHQLTLRAHVQVTAGETPQPFKVNFNSIAKVLMPTKVKTSTPAANGNLIMQDVLRGGGCNMGLFQTSKQGPTFRRTVLLHIDEYWSTDY